MMQQQQMYMSNNIQSSTYKTVMYQNALIQRHTEITQSKADNQITLYKLETQQNELNQCKADRDILTNDNSNLKEKILFFDKSLEILSKEIDKNLSNGMLHLRSYEEKTEVKPREHKTIVNIDLSELSEHYNPKLTTKGEAEVIVKRKRGYPSGSSSGSPGSSHSGSQSLKHAATFSGGSDTKSDTFSIQHSSERSNHVNPLSFATLINTKK